MKASASILVVGLLSMKLPSGRAASSITATASRIAATITGTYWSAMPTAAITESSENTMSMTAICAITAPKVATGLVWMSSDRSEEHTSELQSLMRISYAVFCLKKKTQRTIQKSQHR